MDGERPTVPYDGGGEGGVPAGPGGDAGAGAEWEERGGAEGYWDGGARSWEPEGGAWKAGPSGRANAAMILGIVGIAVSVLCCGFGMVGIACSIVAWVLGHQETRAILSGQSNPEGLGAAKAGVIMGIIGTVLNAILLIGIALYYVLIFTVAIAGAASGA